MSATSRFQFGELLISLALLALGLFVVGETRGIAEQESYAGVGPRLFPYLIGAGLVLTGGWLSWHAMSGGWRDVPLDQQHRETSDWPAFGMISAGVILHMALIGWAGFILVGILLFVLVARGFGSRKIVRDTLIGAALVVVTYYIFVSALGLSLPKGLLKFL
jgi:putative tricarboxylic transport membrane protein